MMKSDGMHASKGVRDGSTGEGGLQYCDAVMFLICLRRAIERNDP